MSDWTISGNLAAYSKHIELRIAQAVAAERERCAKIAEDERLVDDTGMPEDEAFNQACNDIAAKIRGFRNG